MILCESLPRVWIECIMRKYAKSLTVICRICSLHKHWIWHFSFSPHCEYGPCGASNPVRMEPCAERKWVWKCFPMVTSASVRKVLLVHAVRSMAMNAVPVLAWMDIAMNVHSLSHSHACSAVQPTIRQSNEIAQDATRISCWLYPALNTKANASYFHRTFPPLTNSFIFCESYSTKWKMLMKCVFFVQISELTFFYLLFLMIDF